MSRNKSRGEELKCRPLKSLHEVLDFMKNPPVWRTLCKELNPHSEYLIKNAELAKYTSWATPPFICHTNTTMDVRRHHKNKLPKTLVCHDMANGYHDDSMIDGTGDSDAYTFYNWAGIDIFCYFSHHFVTVPPLGWINMAHEHGVKVLGTVITEWKEGAEFWDAILETEWQNFASALIAIAKTLKFDGWLLNIENKVSNPDKLVGFVQYLHKHLHRELRDPMLIWYDSVTSDGHLNWQNGLNDKNKVFFDACDGIFTNYSWSKSDVETSVRNAGYRLHDLYIGMDVWGRNFFGGGMFNLQSAVEVAFNLGCSIAIFAPAWTHEGITNDDDVSGPFAEDTELELYDRFLLRERALWDSIWPYLRTRVPCILPFKTSFCRGQGKKRRIYGEVVGPTPWYNLRHMQYQPNSSHGAHGYILTTQNELIEASNIHNQHRNKGNLKQTIQQIASGEVFEIVNMREDTEPSTSLFEPTTNNNEVIRRSVFKEKISRAYNKIISKKKKSKSKPIAEPEATVPKEDVDRTSMIKVSVMIKLGRESARAVNKMVLAYVPEERQCLEVYYNDSFTGGSCLKVNPCDEICREHRLSRLFHCDFIFDQSLICCVVTKALPDSKDQYLNIVLFGTDSDGEHVQTVLDCSDLPGKPKKRDVWIFQPLRRNTEPFIDLQKYLVVNEPGFYVPVENSYGWYVWYFEVKGIYTHVTSVNCRTGNPTAPILLGHIGFCKRNNVKLQY